jgi:hypothetical protein
MQQEQNDETTARVLGGVVHGVLGSYVGAVLFFITLGIVERTERLWTRESLSFLFLSSLAGMFILSWWIVPAMFVVVVWFSQKLSRWSRKVAAIRGVLLGAALGLVTAICFSLVCRGSCPIETIRGSFAFFPTYCAVWCGGYSWLKGKHNASKRPSDYTPDYSTNVDDGWR